MRIFFLFSPMRLTLFLRPRLTSKLFLRISYSHWWEPGLKANDYNNKDINRVKKKLQKTAYGNTEHRGNDISTCNM